MRKSLLLLTFFAFFFGACQKMEDSLVSNEVLRFTITNDQPFEHNLGAFGIEEGALVAVEPLHAERSEITLKAGSADRFYTYKANNNYTGSDYVEIRSARGSDGASENNKIKITKIHFTITD